MTTQQYPWNIFRFLPVLLVMIVAVTLQSPAQGAREGERELLSTKEFKRVYSDHFRNVADALKFSVVSVEARFSRNIRDRNGMIREIYEEGNYGSGFIYDREGHVITDLRNVLQFPSGFISPLNPNQRGAQVGNYIKITLFNGESFEADFVGLDSATGLAVLQMKRVNPDDLQPVVFSDIKNVEIGEPVMILDYNYVSKNLLGGAFGVVAAIRGQFPSLEQSENEFLMVNFPKIGGNDGGIIIDVFGRVIAMVSSYTPYAETTELHYGIPTDIIKKVCNSLIDSGVYHRPFYGFTLLELNDALKLQEDIDFDEGLYVAYIEPESPAEKAGLQKGDVIYMWDGKLLDDVAIILNTFETKKIGSVIEIEYFHRDFNVWDSIKTEYKLEVQETTESDELERAREREKRYL